jgi:uncharacterized membrane protein
MFTTRRAEDLSQKWLIMWSLFLVTTLIIAFISRWYYKQYLKQYQVVMQSFCTLDAYWIERDKERLQLLINLIAKDSNLLFKYTFNLI